MKQDVTLHAVGRMMLYCSWLTRMKSDADIRSLLLLRLLTMLDGSVAAGTNPSRRPISSTLPHVIRQVDTLP